ncbi:hypothetical protein DSAG12_02838 [Promethearchaeum syntrophicum]|uniref:Uncharacterized protein n=1 Tax=Promethearchaeum syntrophicum TaxID=2594042 RepID=A0A5B9DE43_9ARCH|nr:hypothetical protein [Candidatus Prometheoarchaeum syntrophicum]QEE17006.1 hypothetical protein DSAG12_02838 [Candidatus Prometheoarchaeum syntrophicum]
MECSENTPIIITFGVESSLNDILQLYLQKKYHLIRIQQEISLQYIRMYENVMLIIINSDQPWIRNSKLIKKIHNENIFQEVPIIGLCLKKYFKNMDNSERYLYDDILLLPCNNEDILTRIEVWTNTAEFLMNYEKESKTFSIDSLDF